MRKLLRWLFLIALVVAGLAFAGQSSATSTSTSRTSGSGPGCGVTPDGGRSYDAGTMTCVGSGSDCPGVST